MKLLATTKNGAKFEHKKRGKFTWLQFLALTRLTLSSESAFLTTAALMGQRDVSRLMDSERTELLIKLKDVEQFLQTPHIEKTTILAYGTRHTSFGFDPQSKGRGQAKKELTSNLPEGSSNPSESDRRPQELSPPPSQTASASCAAESSIPTHSVPPELSTAANMDAHSEDIRFDLTANPMEPPQSLEAADAPSALDHEAAQKLLSDMMEAHSQEENGGTAKYHTMRVLSFDDMTDIIRRNHIQGQILLVELAGEGGNAQIAFRVSEQAGHYLQDREVFHQRLPAAEE